MPCGGVYPSYAEIGVKPITFDCLYCGDGGARHFCEEWDGYLHALCAVPWLSTEEGMCVIAHRHAVLLDFDLEEPPLIVADEEVL